MTHVSLDLHDFSVVHPRLDVLLRLKDHFPGFRVSLFTIPLDKKTDYGPCLVREDSLKEIKKHLDWLQIIPHGLYHDGSEFQHVSLRTFKDVVVDTIHQAFTRDGLPYEEGFCAPHWRWSEEVVRGLNDLDWWGAVDRDKVMPTPRRFYRYNYLLNEPFYLGQEPVLKIHGHVYGTRNDILRCWDGLIRLPADTQWHFVTDYLETYD